MKWKSTLVLLFLVIAAGAYVSLYELKQPLPEEREALSRQVARINAETATLLAINMGQREVVLQKTDGHWRARVFADPATAVHWVRADSQLVGRILNELEPLEAERALMPSKGRPLALADYGLQPPRGSLIAGDASQTMTLLFGESTAIGGNRYVKRADTAAVYVIADTLFTEADQPLETFRSRDLFDTDFRSANRIAITSTPTRYTLEKSQGRWNLIEPIADATNPNTVSLRLGKLQELRAQRFITDAPTPDELASWGLEPPAARITLTVTGQPTPTDVLIGHATADNPDQRYAKRSDEPVVCAVPGKSVDELLQDPQALRSHACFDFFTEQVIKAQVTGSQVSWTIEKVGNVWKDASGRAMEPAKLEAWLNNARDLKLNRFVEDAPQDVARYGLNPPQGTIAVWASGQDEPQTLMIGAPVENGLTRYGQIKGRNSVVELPELIGSIWTASPDAWRASPAGSSSASESTQAPGASAE